MSADPDFSRHFALRWAVSEASQAHRVYKYGATVAEDYREDLTPELAREKWKVVFAQHKADAETCSESESATSESDYVTPITPKVAPHRKSS